MVRTIALPLIPVLLLLPTHASAEGPATRVQGAIIRALAVLQEAPPDAGPPPDELQTRLRGLVDEVFDWQEMSRQILSKYWESLTLTQHDQFAALFGDIVRRSYLATVRTFPGERIGVRLLDETIDGDRAVVRTTLTTKSSVTPITYWLLGHEEVWKVYDVAIDGVSVMSNSRSQIRRLIDRFGYDGMMTMLRAKQSQLMADGNARTTAISRIEASP